MTDLGKYFSSEELDSAKTLITYFHGRPMITDELSGKDALCLVLYMLANERKTSMIERKTVEKFFAEAGRNKMDKKSTSEFSKAFYDVNKAELATSKGDMIGLTFRGLSRVQELLIQGLQKRFNRS